MKRFFAVLALAFALPAFAQTCFNPTDGSKITTSITPYFAAPALYQCGYDTHIKTGGSMADACQNSLNSYTGNIESVCNCNGSGCFATSGGVCSAYSWYAGNGGSPGTYFCLSGYTLNGSTCKLTTATSFDAKVLTYSGSTVARNTDGNITSITGGDLNNFTTTSFDSLKRATQIVPPNGNTVSYTYVGDTSSIATASDLNGTTSFTYLDPTHVSAVTLPDGSIYNLGYGTDASGNKFLNGVGVVNGVIGGTRAGTLAPYGIPIPYVTSALEVPKDKMLALLLEGLEVPEFHAEPVGVQPYASVIANGENNTQGDFMISYADTLANANSGLVYPTALPGSPAPSSCVIAGAGGNQNPYCIMWHGIAMSGCLRGTSANFYACVNNVWLAYRAMGC